MAAQSKIHMTQKKKITPLYARVLKRFKSLSHKYPVETDIFYRPDFLDFFYATQNECKSSASPVLELEVLSAENLPQAFCKAYPFPWFLAFSVTMGESADALISFYAGNNEVFKSYLIDAWYSESVEVINETVEAFILHKLGAYNCVSYSSRFSPGYGSIGIKDNQVVQKAAHFSCVSVNPDSGILFPRKSTICLLGFTPTFNINEFRRAIYENLNNFFAS